MSTLPAGALREQIRLFVCFIDPIGQQIKARNGFYPQTLSQQSRFIGEAHNSKVATGLRQNSDSTATDRLHNFRQTDKCSMFSPLLRFPAPFAPDEGVVFKVATVQPNNNRCCGMASSEEHVD